VLHILNGDSTAGILKQSVVQGEMLSWHEALMAGPTPPNLSRDQWIDMREKHLSEAYALTHEDCKKDLSALYAGLQTFSQHDEVVLWFEHDLFCQINLIHVLDWFSKQNLGKTKLSLICIDRFSGRESFRGLGELTPTQLASLFDQRHEVSSDEKKFAAEAWAAYCSPTPQALVKFLEKDTSELPFLKAALSKHLARFPSVKNGLGNIENKTLELIAGGASEFQKLFPAFGKVEPIYGLGDAQFWNGLQRMIKVEHPLLTHRNRQDVQHTPNNALQLKASFALTEAGRAVLNGESDFIALNGIDQWLGGVRLRPENLWRWDEQNQKMIQL
jgi:hypothetical protein